jgi:hypothetical protein
MIVGGRRPSRERGKDALSDKLEPSLAGGVSHTSLAFAFAFAFARSLLSLAHSLSIVSRWLHLRPGISLVLAL